MKKINFSIISLFSFFILWEVLGRYINKCYILPTPLNILKKIWILKEGLFFIHLPATLNIAVISLILTILLGLFLAISMDFSHIVYSCIHPLIITSQTIPITALAPIFILWFGYSI